MSTQKPPSLVEHLKRQREMDRERRRIFGLIQGSIEHDRYKCECEGCKWYWRTVTGFQNGHFYKRFLNIKDCVREQGVKVYLNSFLTFLRKVRMTNGTPIWIAYPNNNQTVLTEM